jgi:hypothetical protein
MKILITDIEAIGAALDALAPPLHVRTECSKAEAVAALAPRLLEQRKKGHGLGALAAMLTERGLPISPGTLKNYLQRAGAAKGKRRRREAVSSPAARAAPELPPPAARPVASLPATSRVKVTMPSAAPSPATTPRSFEGTPRRDTDDI